MIRNQGIVLILIVVFSATSPTSSYATPGATCVVSRLQQRLLSGKESRAAAEAARNKFNAQLKLEIASVPADRRLELVKDAIKARGELVPGFPSDEFISYLERHTDTTTSESKLGQLLDRAYKGFEAERSVAKAKTKESIQDAIETPRKAGWKCRSAQCSDQEINRFAAAFREKLSKTCLVNNPVAIKQMAQNWAITWTAFALYQWGEHDPKISNYPWEFVASGLIWGAVFAEVGCRNTFARVESPGSEIPKPDSAAKRTGRKLWAYQKWMAASNVTAVGAGYLADRYLRDNEKPLKDYGNKFLYYTAYDAAMAPLERVFVLDPLFLKAFPWAGGAVKKLIKNKALAVGAMSSVEMGARFVLNWGDTEIFFKAENGFKNWLSSQENLSINSSHFRQPDPSALEDWANQWGPDSVRP